MFYFYSHYGIHLQVLIYLWFLLICFPFVLYPYFIYLLSDIYLASFWNEAEYKKKTKGGLIAINIYKNYPVHFCPYFRKSFKDDKKDLELSNSIFHPEM